MATAPRPSEPDLARIRRWVEDRVPVEHQDEVRVEMALRGANVTIYELRPPWRDDLAQEWSRRPVAQLRHTGSGYWLLLWPDRRDRWQRHPLALDVTRDLGSLLRELDEDGLCLFWG